MDMPPAEPDLRLGDDLVTLSDLRDGDLVRLERLGAHTVGLRAVAPGDEGAHAGYLFRIELGDRAGAARLVRVRAPGPQN